MVEGRNIAIDVRLGGRQSEQIPSLAAELVAQQPERDSSRRAPASCRRCAARRRPSQSSSSPVADPGRRWVLSRALRDRAATSRASLDLRGEYHRQMAGDAQGDRPKPFARRSHRTTQHTTDDGYMLRGNQGCSAHRWRSNSMSVEVDNASDIEQAIAMLARTPTTGLVSAARRDSRSSIAVSSSAWLPSIAYQRYTRSEFFVDAGGLMSYGTDLADAYRQAASYVEPHPQGREAGRSAGAAADQVRTGHQPEDRQGARPRPFHRLLLARADEVIE